MIIMPKFSFPSIDLTTKNAAIFIVIFLELVFLGVSIWTTILSSHIPALASVASDLWKLFVGTNGALLLALNVTGRKDDPPPPSIIGK